MSDTSFEHWHEFEPRWHEFAVAEGKRLGVQVSVDDEGRLVPKGEAANQAEWYPLVMDMLVRWNRGRNQTSAVL